MTGKLPVMIKTGLLGVALFLGLAFAPAAAQEGHATVTVEKQPWTFGGVFGTFDKEQLQRGFQVFQAVCAQCHGARLMAFRNLAEKGGPEFSEEQVKARHKAMICESVRHYLQAGT